MPERQTFSDFAESMTGNGSGPNPFCNDTGNISCPDYSTAP
jgi:hypothetical protein